MHARRMPSQSNVLMYTINTSWREPTLTAESSPLPSPLAMALGSTGQENKGEGEEGGRKERGRGRGKREGGREGIIIAAEKQFLIANIQWPLQALVVYIETENLLSMEMLNKHGLVLC